jgi:hypothetical protein
MKVLVLLALEPSDGRARKLLKEEIIVTHGAARERRQTTG